MKTYVLGAGASKHAGYPLANCFDKDLAVWVLGKEAPSPNDLSLVDFLTEITGSLNFEDALEAVTTLVNTPRENLSEEDRLLRAYFGQHLAHLKQVIRAWFLELQPKRSDVYDAFAQRVMCAGDTVISFNYDLALEMALRSSRKWEIKDGYGFPIDGFGGISPTKILKLHGSINWFAVPFGGMKGFFQFNGGSSLGNRPVIMDYDARLLGYETERDVLWPSNGAAVVSPMILPARTKEFFFRTSHNPNEWVGFWNALWADAGTSLGMSDEVCICGYSLPLADERARNLIFSSTSKSARVEVSCGGDTNRIADEFRAAGFNNVVGADDVYFESWVRSKSATEVV